MKRRVKRLVLRRLGGLFGGLSGGLSGVVGRVVGVASWIGGLGLGVEAVSFGITRGLQALGGHDREIA